jgi:hypothetical protein
MFSLNKNIYSNLSSTSKTFLKNTEENKNMVMVSEYTPVDIAIDEEMLYQYGSDSTFNIGL